MKFAPLTAVALGFCSGVIGHSHHEHQEGGDGVASDFDPLRAPEFVQDSLEELERKWSFEVS